MIKLVIFDLDGTLLNTIADLAASTNYALKQLGYPTHPTDDYLYMVGNGINKLFERALPEDKKTEEEILRMRQLFVKHYEEHIHNLSKPYEGILTLLETLQERNIAMAVASNKYQAGVEKLVNHFFSNIKFVATLGQRTDIPVKPNPQIVYDILNKIKVDNSEVLYVGDTNVDMQTAKNANLIVCGVSWGMRPVEELQAFKPTYIIDKPSEIINIIDKLN